MTPLEPADGSSADPARCRRHSPGAGHHESPGKRGLTEIAARSWSYVTLGYGHGEQWWRAFCYRLRMAGYDRWRSIEHEDVMLSRREGLTKSLAFLKSVAPSDSSDYAPQEF